MIKKMWKNLLLWWANYGDEFYLTNKGKIVRLERKFTSQTWEFSLGSYHEGKWKVNKKLIINIVENDVKYISKQEAINRLYSL